MEPSFQNLPTVTQALTEALGERVPLTELTAGKYASMKYPRFPVLMRFHVKRYAAPGYGNVFAMDTRAMGGLMQLCTVVCTPNAGTDIPFMLIDAMAMGKKYAAFVEYYDCTGQGAACPLLAEAAQRYAELPGYPEKPAWYVNERTADSLIKGGSDSRALTDMLLACAAAYGESCKQRTVPRAENLAGLSKFIGRMVEEGNPSSATMTKVLGREGAEAFFRSLVMPEAFTDQNL